VTDHGLRLPPPVSPPARAPFPVLATVAPVVGSVVLWLVTGSPFALVFALLGPLVAIAGVLDRRRGARRASRRADAGRARALERLRAEVVAAHDLERAAGWRADPGPRAIVDGSVSRLPWTGPEPMRVVVGVGEVRSTVRLEGEAVDDAAIAIVREAGRLPRAPVVVDAARGIGIVGPVALGRALARGMLVQACHAAAPDELAVHLPGGPAWSWARALPHVGSAADRSLRVVEGGADASGPAAAAGATLVLADRRDRLVARVGAVVELDGPGAARVSHADGEVATCAPVLLGEPESRSWAREAAARVAEPAAAAPGPVPFDVGQSGGPGLTACVGVSGEGPALLDLAAGPHALVAGTTGSGKSGFLVAWAAAMAASRTPEELTLVLVDFKGAAAFGPLERLPHVAGVFTDLDEPAARRLVRSLPAEVRRREALLRDAGVPTVDALPPRALPRLVVVVDEYQEFARRIPEAAAVFADLSSRGRSLGMHLVLGTQRPSAAIGEAIRANAGVRACLRVLQPSESIAMLGTPEAARIPVGAPGSGLVDGGDGTVAPFRSALVGEADLDAIGRRHADAPVPPPPWAPPLPGEVTPALVSAALGAPVGPDRIPLGLADDVDRQRHVAACWQPSAGALLVAGGVGSGRSTLLAAVRAGLRAGRTVVELSPAAPRSLVWDVLRRPGERGPLGVVIDDLDDLFDGWGEEYRAEAQPALDRLLRTRGVAVAASTRRPVSTLGASRLGALFRETVLLRQPSAQDVRAAGGDPELWAHDDPPGTGQWHGLRFHALRTEPGPTGRHVRLRGAGDPARGVAPVSLPRGGVALACSASPRAFAERWRDATGGEALLLDPADHGARQAVAARTAAGPRSDTAGPLLVVGDAGAWASSWGVVAAQRESATLLADGVPANLRALTGDRELPPLLDVDSDMCWSREPGRETRRCAWPD